MTARDTMTTRTYTVEGMTCGHCVNAVTEEVEKVDGVSSVDVDLDTKTVTVSGDPLDDAAIAAAIDEAGYAVSG
jgi:copper chaperone